MSEIIKIKHPKVVEIPMILLARPLKFEES